MCELAESQSTQRRRAGDGPRGAVLGDGLLSADEPQPTAPSIRIATSVRMRAAYQRAVTPATAPPPDAGARNACRPGRVGRETIR